MNQVLRINRATMLVLRPEPPGQLAANEKVAIAAGSVYPLQSYAYADIDGGFNGHIKVAFRDSAPNGFNTWFVPSRDAQVEAGGVVVYPHEDQEGMPVLWINTSTLLKRRPLDSGLLDPSETVAVSRGQTYNLHSYAFADSQGNFNNHIKIAIRNPEDFVNGLSTWFVYTPHAFVTLDEDVVFPRPDPNAFVLRVTASTLFKRRPVDSGQLAPIERVAAAPGTTIVLSAYAFADAQGSFNGHIRFTIKYVKDDINGLNTWYVFQGHARVERAGVVVYPPPTAPPPPQYVGRPFRLPGNTSTFYTDQPIIPGGSFTWGEATRDATRIPETQAIVDNIIGLARALQGARDRLNRPFQITSWYRPPAVNAAVGGASRSQHLFGRAADIQVQGLSGRQVANALMLSWPGGMGIYGNIPNIIHLDTGPKRTWGF
ncbi:D-Ala-D-Ala carboxypeptidase family metallohydrolase [Leptolyngbya sp. CCNP1308]|uniref:YcbK family protein n=1 Tax=Leptolyngbya sp. CCNP1308 TaxID=3110255 RepID=UPI002B203619|nr:D-Ala-D-Ala carboxypeptidase family metallohydrolase [Leptolyngbya sp. CCNP1308]MEA5452626.1 D-Ala-D-Ala carboxypeptidase family metallohydrolase [Leptolyngbya sp. CCNP1308]